MGYDILVWRRSDLANPYVKVVRVIDGYLFDYIGQVMLPGTTWPTVATLWQRVTQSIAINSALSLSAAVIELQEYNSSLGTGVPPGIYDICIYEMAGASRVSTDNLILTKRIEWTGNKILGLPKAI